MMFYFRLARELGKTVSRMLDEMSSREIAGWMAFFDLDDKQTKREQQKQSDKMLGSRIKAAGKQVANRTRKKALQHGKRKV